MEIVNFKVPFPKVSEHQIVPLEDRTTFWGRSAFLAGFIELDLLQEMKTRVNPLPGSFVPPGVFVIQGDAYPPVRTPSRYLRKSRFYVKWNHGAQPTGLSKFPAPCRPALLFDRCKRLLRARDRHRAASPACSGSDPVSGKDATLRHGLREPFSSASAAVP
jgi:hypothetical protein